MGVLDQIDREKKRLTSLTPDTLVDVEKGEFFKLDPKGTVAGVESIDGESVVQEKTLLISPLSTSATLSSSFNKLDLIDQIKILSKTNLYFFIKVVLAYGAPYFNKMYPPLHMAMCKAIQGFGFKSRGKDNRMVMLWPRGTYKSSIYSKAFPLWQTTIYEPTEESTVLISNASATLPKQWLNEVMVWCEQNDLLRAVIADELPGKKDRALRWSTEELQFRHGQRIRGIGVGGKIVGTHVGFLIEDDLVDDKNHRTEMQRDSVIQWHIYSTSLLADEHDSAKMVVGTTWHFGDLYAWIKEHEQGYTYIRQPLLTESNESIYPTKHPVEKVANLKRGNEYWFSAQYMLCPLSPADAIVSIEDIQYFDGLHDPHLPHRSNLRPFMYVDPAFSTKTRADYTAATVILRSENAVYVIYNKSQKLPTKQMLDWIISVAVQFKDLDLRTINTEVGGPQLLMVPALEEAILRAGERASHLSVAPHKVSNQVSKEDRLRMILGPWFKRREVYLLRNQRELENQLLTIPNAQHDDQADSLAGAIAVSYPPIIQTYKQPVDPFSVEAVLEEIRKQKRDMQPKMFPSLRREYKPRQGLEVLR